MIRLRLLPASIFPALIALLVVVPSAVAQQWYWEGTWDVYDPAGQICIDSTRGVLVKTSAPEGGGDLHRSSDQGASWKYIGHNYLGGLATAPNGNVFAAEFGGGVERSTDNGVTWSDAGFPAETYGPIAATGRGHVFVAEGLSKLWRSTDDGTSWSAVPNEFEGRIRHIAVGRTGDIFVAALGIYRSSDSGDSWTHLDLRNATGEYPVAGTIAVDSRGYLFAIINGDSIATSTDNGDSWAHLGSVGGSNLRSLTVGPNDELFVGREYSQYSDLRNGVWRSTDGGVRWDTIGPQGGGGWELAYDPGGYVYASSTDGFYRGRYLTRARNILGRVIDTSYFNRGVEGATVTLFNSDSTFVRETHTTEIGSYRFEDIPSGSYRLGASHSGLQLQYSEQSAVLLDSEIVIDFRLGRAEVMSVSSGNIARSTSPHIPRLTNIFPNPTNDRFAIEFDLPVRLPVSIRLLDVLGREIAVIASGEMESGTHTLYWSRTAIPDGVYFCELRSGMAVDMYRVFLLR